MYYHVYGVCGGGEGGVGRGGGLGAGREGHICFRHMVCVGGGVRIKFS